MIRRCLLLIVLLVFPVGESGAFDWATEGRIKAGSVYIFDSPRMHKDFDSEAELRLGVLGNAFEKNEWKLDYELSADAKLADGPSVQAGLRKETDVDFFRAWLRLDKGSFKVRGGRQKILFGSGAIFRPLGFFDTRDVTGVVPETRGVDGVRSTYFFDETTSLQGWVVPAKQDDRLIAGLRWEGLLLGMETGLVVQYHPNSDLQDLPEFDQELIQLGYHFKGEYKVGFWNESRLDMEPNRRDHPLRFDTVLGVDYTFGIGEGLHVLLEYFLSTRQGGFTPQDPSGDTAIHELGLLLDQPVGIDIRWQVFGLYDMGDGSFQVVPQVEYAWTDDVFLYLSGRWGGRARSGVKTGRLFAKTPVFNGTEANMGLTLVVYF